MKSNVVFFYSGDKCIGFRAHGHAGDAPHGENIVCAAVSAILQTAYLGLTKVANLIPHWRSEEKTAHMECYTDCNLQADLILRTAQAGIAAIAQEHPKSVILLKEQKNV